VKSIRRALIVTLLSAFTLVMFVASLNGYLASMQRAEELLDDQLIQLSEVLAHIHLANDLDGSHGASVRGPKAPTVYRGSESMAYQIIQNDRLLSRTTNAAGEPWLDWEEGFGYQNFDAFRWRVYTRDLARELRIVVAERADVRFVVAETVVLQSIYPLLTWLPILAILTWGIVTWGLKPLSDLSRRIGVKQDSDLTPLQMDRTPAELEQITRSLNGLLSRLAAAFARERQFAATAAHELRTPLSVAKVHMHNLRAGAEALIDSQAINYVDESINKLQRVVQQILDLSRTQPEVLRTQFHNVDLVDLLQQCCAQLYPSFESAQQSLEFNCELETVMVRGDEPILELLFENLLTNANRYTPTGGHVSVSIERDERFCTVCVDDSGPGIPPTQREQIFERFYRVDKNQHREGVGLGLAIVGQIAFLHNAIIKVDESPMNGARFTVKFPAHKGGTHED
jgi:two-component system sensor histidine kinase QseC